MTSDDDSLNGVFPPIYSTIMLAGAFVLVWWQGGLRDVGSWGMALVLLVLYVLICVMAFPTFRQGSGPALGQFLAELGHSRRLPKVRQGLLYLLLPGWYVGRLALRCVGIHDL